MNDVNHDYLVMSDIWQNEDASQEDSEYENGDDYPDDLESRVEALEEEFECLKWVLETKNSSNSNTSTTGKQPSRDPVVKSTQSKAKHTTSTT